MGWHGNTNWKSKKDVVEELTKTEVKSGPKGQIVRTTLKKSCRKEFGRHILWSVVETHNKGEGSVERRICCDLIEPPHGPKGGPAHYWSYKPMAEEDFPFYFSCPISYLKLVPESSPGVRREWRELVRDFHSSS